MAIQADHTNIAGCIRWAAGKVLQGSYLNETASLLSGKRKSAVYIIFVHYKAVQGDFGTSVCVNWRKRALRLSEFLFFNVDLKINKEMFRYQISPVLCLVSTILRDYPRSPNVRGSGNFLLKESGIHEVESRIQNCLGFPYMGRPEHAHFDKNSSWITHMSTSLWTPWSLSHFKSDFSFYEPAVHRKIYITVR